ncbi:MAG: tRNA lysidine(34) synthetase TilS [Saprospiraceae bacterium]
MHVVLEAINACLLNIKEKSFLIALSGGHDSMVLCKALLEFNIPFGAAHCNYGLRGQESDQDALFIQEFCNKFGIRLHLKIEKINPLNSGNIQNEARNIRHDFFKELIQKHGYDYLLLAHHGEDRIESFLINLMRGSGIKGLSTMPQSNLHILRPFIGLTKAELHDYALKSELVWREDSSNLESKYYRNKIRHQLIPEFLNLNPTFLQNAIRSIQHLYDSHLLLNSFKENWLMHQVSITSTGYSINYCNSIEDLFLFEFLAELGFHSKTIEEIKSNLLNSGLQFESHLDWLAFTDRNRIIITNKQTGKEEEQEILIYENQSFVPLQTKLLKVMRRNKNEVGETFKYALENMAFLDIDKISFPLKLRRWKQGDIMKPLGMKNQVKKLQDILTDKKISIPDKRECYVLISKDEIIWLVNYCLSESVKLTTNTKNILYLEYLEIDN